MYFVVYISFFFFSSRRRHTRCSRDWSSDVCSSDYGSSVILEKLDNGRDVLLAGQKSGVVYALDPDRKGEILWQLRVGQGGTNGGVQWGMASDSNQVYAATSDVTRVQTPQDPLDPRPQFSDPKVGGGLTAIRIANGEKVL